MARPKDGKLVRRISSSILEDSYLRLEEIADAEQGSVAQVIRRAVEEFIANRSALDQPRLPLRRGAPRSTGMS
jgi:hypothetical protein